MNKINVLHIVEDLKIGGLERVIDTIVTGQDRTRFNPKVWCLVRGGEVFDELKHKGFDVEVLNMKSHRHAFFFIGLCRRLKKEKIHILHTHGTTATTLGRLAGIFAGTPVILSHKHTSYNNRTYKQKAAEKMLNCFTDRILCCSQSVADHAVQSERVDPGKLEVIYNGVDLDRYAGTPVKGAEACKDFTVGCVASLAPHKGHKYLLDAAKHVIENAPLKVSFVLVGKGALREELENYAERLGIKSHIDFREPVSDVSEIITTFDLAVLPSSEREGLGLAIIEAMAAGKPVIATSVGGLPEVVVHGRNGFLVPPKDGDSLAQAMLSLCSQQGRAVKMGAEGQAIAGEKFSAEKMVDKIEELYLGLLSKNVAATEI